MQGLKWMAGMVILLAGVLPAARAQEIPAKAVPLLRELANHEMPVGEYLEYSVHFGKLSAGWGALSLEAGDSLNGRAVYLLTSRLWTNDFFSGFYRVDDVMKSWLDRRGVFPWRYERTLREGKFKAFRKAVFDPLHQCAFEGKDTLAVPAYSQDLLSIIYYVRTLDLEVGNIIDLNSYVDKKVYPLRLTVKKKEMVKVPAGKFECFLLVPGKQPGSKLEPKGEMWIWLTSDQRRLPVRIQSKAELGSVTMSLDIMKIIK
ncbi:MAG TPA: DUF3108 domain-containing protein [bacterium]|nr:DUF3108 domain-containing protein [bacterium]HQG44345.1 DUF3108 domain-containing protein [bacterium]HQI49086.1 DUF3108 domain-containing protein [bacterium]HQJ63287.1 DUF3108 domain-containing protein [bacterium]